MKVDVLVIGGGPAGLAAGIAAAQAGLSVAVAEACPGARDKCCGEGLLPLAVASLEQLGIPPFLLRREGYRLDGIAFEGAGRFAEAAFPSSQQAYGMRRTVLHNLLTERAREAGVELVASRGRLLPEQDEPAAMLGNTVCEPRWVVGADGAQSATRTVAGLDSGRTVSRRFALRQHFLLRDPVATPKRVLVHWAEGTEAYVTPVARGMVSIAVLAREKLQNMEAALLRFPALRSLLAEASPCTSVRGAVSLHRTLRQVQRGHVALIGDASGSVDAITGDGLSIASRQALALAAALRAGDLRLYQAAQKHLLRTPRILSRTLLGMAHSRRLRNISLSALEHVPALFPALLALHTEAGAALR